MKKSAGFYLLFLLAGCDAPDNQRTGINHIKTNLAADTNTSGFQPLDQSDMDTAKAQQAQAVIKARLVHDGTGDKFIWDTISVIRVLQNKTVFKFPGQLQVARYSWDKGIQCNGECTLYLIPYPFGSRELNDKNEWMLLGGKASAGVVCD